MSLRRLTPVDRLLAGVGEALRTVAGATAGGMRENPAAGTPEGELGPDDRARAARLMRVNHAGEVAAQALYQGHATVARDPAIAAHMRQAADEERDHLQWCEERLRELGSRPSRLGACWYAGAFAIGAASGVLGDRWSLGFVAETERQVAAHLDQHLERLPAGDGRSRSIVSRMREEEIAHGKAAGGRGAARLPAPVRGLMRLSAGIMKRTAYWL